MTTATALPWPTDALAASLGALRPGLRVEVLAEADSSNTRLLERARGGDVAPCLLVVERQTAGRGRMGRPWFTEPAAAGAPPGPGTLCLSLGLVLAPADWSGLSLAVGVALAEALGPAVQLKWPNDLWLAGRKLGGVLIETLPLPDGGRYAVIGVGLNLATPTARPGLEQPVAGWRETAPQVTADQLLSTVAAPLVEAVQVFEGAGFAAFTSRYAARDALAGRPVQTRGAEALQGVADGVDAQGALRVRTADGSVAVRSGEVSVRPC
ncbi:MAG TPA: biotin--[acetyl-CoA-carboxylase] ligase [Methylibium sp.]|nr:biotin--[acetyl-CoA-carboxylase] ligase [Methylibium sp.]